MDYLDFVEENQSIEDKASIYLETLKKWVKELKGDAESQNALTLDWAE